jgi:hypothetical protein
MLTVHLVIACTHSYLLYQWQLLTYSVGIFTASSCQFSTIVWHMITVFMSKCFQLTCTLFWSIAQPHVSPCSQYAADYYVQYAIYLHHTQTGGARLYD